MRKTRESKAGGDQVVLLKALADETRLRLVRLLAREELNVQELALILKLPQPTISRHLAVLKQVGLVGDRRDGPRSFYALAEPLPEPLAPLASYLESVGGSEHPDVERLAECLRQRAALADPGSFRRAEEWDRISQGLHHNSAGMMALAALASPSGTFVDLGTGTGTMLPCLAAMAAQVYAVDQSPHMLAQARRRCQRQGLANVAFIQAPIEALDSRLPPADGMLLHFVLHQTARPGAVLQHLRPFVCPGGRLVVVDSLPHQDEKYRSLYGSRWLGFSREQMQEWLGQSGFRMLSWWEFSPPEGRTAGSFACLASPP